MSDDRNYDTSAVSGGGWNGVTDAEHKLATQERHPAKNNSTGGGATLGALVVIGWFFYMMWSSYFRDGELLNPETADPEDRIMAYTSHDRNLCGFFNHDRKAGYICMTASAEVHTIYICDGYLSANTNTTNTIGCLAYKIPNYEVGLQFPSRKQFLTTPVKELFVTETPV